MDGQDWLEGQFDRAVEIVQGLSKTGPIQTGYEEKLAMYSLYKQATVGNVPSTRPGIWDVLGRAKWDAWARHRDLDPYEAKRQYVDTLQRVLRKYSGRTVARDLVRELDAYRPEASVDDEASYEPRSSSSVASSPPLSPQPISVAPDPDPDPDHEHDPAYDPTSLLHSASTEQWGQVSRSAITAAMDDDAFSAGAELTSQGARPMSSLSSALRYRTPMTHSTALPTSDRALSPPPLSLGALLGQSQPLAHAQTHHYLAYAAPLPHSQPVPRHATPSAYAPAAAPAAATAGSSGSGPVSSRTSVGFAPSAPAAPGAGPAQVYPHPYGHVRALHHPDTSAAPGQGPGQGIPFPHAPGTGTGPGTQSSLSRARPPLERALESMQASLAALHERLEGIESATLGLGGALPGGAGGRGGGGAGERGVEPSGSLGLSGAAPGGRSRVGSSAHGRGRGADDPWAAGGGWGMWGLVLAPLGRLLALVRRAVGWARANDAVRRSPVLAVVRRLMLDLSFVLAVLAVVRWAVRRGGGGWGRADVGRLVAAVGGVGGVLRDRAGRGVGLGGRGPRARADAGVQA